MMTDSDHPAGAAAAAEPMSFDKGVSALEDILTPPEKPGPGRDGIQKDAIGGTDEVLDLDAPDTAAAAEEVPEEGEESADADATEPDENDEEVVEFDDETVVDLGNGQRATLAELKATHQTVQKRLDDAQRGVTQKMMEVGETRREVETQAQRVLQSAQQVAQARDLVVRFFQSYGPQPPSQEMIAADPVGYLEKKTAHEQFVAQMNALQQATQEEQQKTQQQHTQEIQQRVQQEREKLLELEPDLKDPKKIGEIRTRMQKVFEGVYGFKPGEWQNVADHRANRVMIDAMRWREHVAKVPEAKEKIAGKPKLLRSGKRPDAGDKAKTDQRAREARLKKTGDLTAAVDVLMGFDL